MYYVVIGVNNTRWDRLRRNANNEMCEFVRYIVSFSGTKF